MLRNIGRFITHAPRRTNTNYDLNKFKTDLSRAASRGIIDTASAIEHVHRVSTLVAKEKHIEAARYIDDVNAKLGIQTGHTLK